AETPGSSSRSAGRGPATTRRWRPASGRRRRPFGATRCRSPLSGCRRRALGGGSCGSGRSTSSPRPDGRTRRRPWGRASACSRRGAPGRGPRAGRGPHRPDRARRRHQGRQVRPARGPRRRAGHPRPRGRDDRRPRPPGARVHALRRPPSVVLAKTQMTTSAPRVLVLSRSDVAELLRFWECIAAVEEAFRREAEGRTLPAGVLSIPAAGGGFHVKAAGVRGERSFFAAKVNANFSGNPERFGLPTIQGVIVFCDAERGSPLALLDSAEITMLRTAAATAVAARHLARPESAVATVCGCGRQGRAQLAALAEVLPLNRAYACARDAGAAER